MSKHVHNWILTKTEISQGKLLKFFECIEPHCPNPHRLEIVPQPRDGR